MRQRSTLALHALLDENQLRCEFGLIWIKKSRIIIHLGHTYPISLAGSLNFK